LVNSTISVTNEASITGAAGTSWNSVAISSANTNTSLALTDFVDGTYMLYTLDAAGNFSSVSTNSLTVTSATPTIYLSAIAAGAGGYVINGESAGDSSGFAVSNAGDVNGDGLDDLLVSAGDATALARALQTLLQDDARAQQLGAINFERIERDGQRAAQMDAMAGLYRELLAPGAGARQV
jgi:hypothetical protein